MINYLGKFFWWWVLVVIMGALGMGILTLKFWILAVPLFIAVQAAIATGRREGREEAISAAVTVIAKQNIQKQIEKPADTVQDFSNYIPGSFLIDEQKVQ